MIGRNVKTRALQIHGREAIGALAPNLDQEVQRLCKLHGKNEVAAALKRVRSSRVGRPPEPDGPVLFNIAMADARDWLEGRDPFALRSNYKVALAEADHNPGQSRDATKRRFERKLRAKRHLFMHIAAEQITRTEYPAIKHIEALTALTKLDGWSTVFAGLLDFAKRDLEDFEQRFPQRLGTQTIEQVQAALRTPELSTLIEEALSANRRR